MDIYKIWLDKLEKYCAQSERCQYDVVQKMHRLKIPENEQPMLLVSLLEDKFVDDERYARLFFQSKVRIKKDGIIKIKFALKQKKIDPQIIEQYLEDESKRIYDSNLDHLITKKWGQLLNKDEPRKAKDKLIRYLLGKGYSFGDFQDKIPILH